jgi:hypothetical protein
MPWMPPPRITTRGASAGDASAEAATRGKREKREEDAPGRTARRGAARARTGLGTRENIVAIAATDELTVEGENRP